MTSSSVRCFSTQIERIFQSLEGAWSFERNIPSYGEVIGTANFTRPSPNDCFYYYREEGIINRHEGGPLPFYRNYRYEYTDGQIRIFFDETPKRLFLNLHFRTDCTKADAEHLCNQDLYQANYEFIDSATFKVTYIVQGPLKSYRLNTTYKKSGLKRI